MGLDILWQLILISLAKKLAVLILAKAYGFPRLYRRALEANNKLLRGNPKTARAIKSVFLLPRHAALKLRAFAYGKEQKLEKKIEQKVNQRIQDDLIADQRRYNREHHNELKTGSSSSSSYLGDGTDTATTKLQHRLRLKNNVILQAFGRKFNKQRRSDSDSDNSSSSSSRKEVD